MPATQAQVQRAALRAEIRAQIDRLRSELEKRIPEEQSRQRRAAQLEQLPAERPKLGPVPIGPSPREAVQLTQPAARFGARAVERVAETGISLTEEIANAGQQIGNLWRGATSRLAALGRGPFAAAERLSRPEPEPKKVRIAPLGLVQKLEENNLLIEANRIERMAGDAGDVAGFIVPIGLVGKAASLGKVARYAQDTFLLAGSSIMEGRRHERETGEKITPAEYGKNAFMAAASVPASVLVGGAVTKGVEKLLQRELGHTVKRLVADATLGAAFELGPQAMAGDFDGDRVMSSMAGMMIGNTFVSMFPGRARPHTKQDIERSIELSAEVVDQLGIGTAARTGSLDPKTAMAVRAQHARNIYRSLSNPVTGEKVKIADAELAQLAGNMEIPVEVMRGISRESYNANEVVQSKLSMAAIEVARKSGPEVLNETMFQRDAMGDVDKRVWARKRAALQNPEKLAITDQEAMDALKQDEALLGLVESRAMQPPARVLVPPPPERGLVPVKPAEIAVREKPGALVPARREVTGKLFPGEGQARPGETRVTHTWKNFVAPLKELSTARRGVTALKKKNPGVEFRIVRTPQGYVIQDRTARVSVQPSPEEMMRKPVTPKALPQRIPRRPPPSTGEPIITPPKEELVGGKRYAETIPTGRVEPALWTPAGDPAKTAASAKAKLTVLKNANPKNKYRISPDNPLLVERELRPARELTRAEVLERENLAQRPIDRQGDIGKKFSGEELAQEAIARLKGQNPNRDFIIRPAGKKSTLKIVVPMPMRKPKRVPQETVRIGGKPQKARVQGAPQPEPETVTQPTRKAPPVAPPEPAKVGALSPSEVRKRKAALREAERKPTAAPRMKDLVDEYYDAKIRGKEGRPESEVRAEMGLVEKGPYKGQSKWFLANKMIWQREWKRYGRQGQKFVRFLEGQPAEHFGGQEAKAAFVAEVRGDKTPAVPEAQNIRPQEGAARRKLAEVVDLPQKPLPPPTERVARALEVANRFLESRVQNLASGYEKLTPQERAKVDKLLDRLEIDRNERAKAEEAIIEADIEIGKELEQRGTLMPDWRPWKALPLLLAGAGLGYAISRGTTDEEEGAALAAGGFFLAGFGKGKGKRLPPGKLRADPLTRWEQAIIRARSTEQAPPEPIGKPRPMPKGAAEEIEKANDAAMEFGARGIDEAMEKLMDPPSGRVEDRPKNDFLQFAVRAVGNALSKYGEAGKLLTDLGQRMLSSATREYRVMMHDLSSISDLRFERPLSRIKQRIHGESDYDNLHTIAEQIHRIVVNGEKIKPDAPNSDKVGAIVGMFARRQYGMTLEALDRAGIKLSPKAKAESDKLTKWLDDHLAHIKDEALSNMMAFSPWQKSAYFPGVWTERFWGPTSGDRLRPDYKSNTERSERLWRLAAEEMAANNGISVDEAYNAINRHGNIRGREPMFQAGLKETRIGAPPSQNLELHRMMDTRVGVEYDVARMVERYSRPAIIRLAFARQFGPRGERAAYLIDKAAKMGYDTDQMTSIFDVLTMQGSKTLFASRMPTLHRMLGELGGFTSLKLLGSAGLSQITAGLRTPIETDYKSAIKAIPGAIQTQLYQSAHVPKFIKKRLASERWARFVAETGPAGQAELVEAMLEMKGAFPKMAAFMLRYNMTTPIDRFLRNHAAIAGRMYTDSVLTEYKTNLQAAHGGAKNAGALKTNRQRLTRLYGQDKAMLEEILRGEYSIARDKRGIFSSNRTRLYEIVGGEIIGNRTQGRLLPADLPAFATDPLLAQLYKLQSFNIRMTADSIRMFNPKDRTSIWRTKADALRVLAAMVAGTGASAGIIYLKRKMRGTEEDWLELPLVQRIADAAAFYGFFSTFYDTWDMSRYGEPSQSMLGPSMQQVFEATDATFSSVRQGEVDPAMRFLLRSIPVGMWNYLGVPTGYEWAKELYPPESKSKQGRRG